MYDIFFSPTGLMIFRSDFHKITAYNLESKELKVSNLSFSVEGIYKRGNLLLLQLVEEKSGNEFHYWDYYYPVETTTFTDSNYKFKI
jgi:hypothetical protein